ncbi:unnamed protein product, partial [Mesorhabditis belari]|uniref:Secreted protein n=1 Tax=Mesorhabditis belari TaxID=2138241 RepID=A0AAF3F047_9BILA
MNRHINFCFISLLSLNLLICILLSNVGADGWMEASKRTHLFPIFPQQVYSPKFRLPFLATSPDRLTLIVQ